MTADRWWGLMLTLSYMVLSVPALQLWRQRQRLRALALILSPITLWGAFQL